MRKLAIIHTTPATIEPLKSLAAEILPDYELINMLDDSILPQLSQNGGNLEEVAPRWIQLAVCAEQAGADAVLSACSSVGELVGQARSVVAIPVLRIDDAMAEEAVRRAERAGVAATLVTTLAPTARLLMQKAAQVDRKVTLETVLVAAAYQKLMEGDKDGHDAALSEALQELAERVDVVVLAQASMARVLSRLPDALQSKFLSSPRSGLERVRQILVGRAASFPTRD